MVIMLTITQFAKRRGLTRQRIHQLILQKRLPGAVRVKTAGANALGVWMIPPRAKIEAVKIIAKSA